MTKDIALDQPIDLESIDNISGALVLGTHALYFAKGEGDLPLKDDAADRAITLSGDVRVFYTSNARVTKSFLLVNGEEVELTGCPTSERFTLDMSMFSTSQRVVELDPGLCAVIAPTAWGKTTVLYRGLLPAISAMNGVTALRRINFVEVFEGKQPYSYDRYTAREQVLLVEILNCMMSKGTVLSVDSLRPFIYAKSVGGTGTAGLDQYLSIQLTALSNLMAIAGSLLITTINPMVTRDDEKGRMRYDEIVTQLVAGTSCAIVGEELRTGQIYPRGFSNPDRSGISMTIIDLSDSALNARQPTLARGVSTDPQETIVVEDAPIDQSVVTAARLVRSANVTQSLKA